MHVGYEMVANKARSAELAIIIIQKCRQNIKNSSCKNNNFQLVFNFEQIRTVTIFGEHGYSTLFGGLLCLCEVSRFLSKLLTDHATAAK